jgi:hypothetical protein
LLLTSASSNSRFLKTSDQHFPAARYNGAEGQKQGINGFWFLLFFIKTLEQQFPTVCYNGAESQKQGTNGYWFLLLLFKPPNGIFQRLATTGQKREKRDFAFVTTSLFTAP